MGKMVCGRNGMDKLPVVTIFGIDYSSSELNKILI